MKIKFLIPLLAGVALLWACKGNQRKEFEVANTSSADTVRRDSAISPQEKLIKTADIRFKVKSVQQTAQHITALTTDLGGMLIHQQMSSTGERSLDIRVNSDSVMRVTSFSTADNMVVKIPHQKLEEFTDKVTLMGIHVDNLTMDINDKSLDYLSSQLKLKSRSELIEKQNRGQIVIKKPEDVLNLKDDMIDQQISNRHIDDAVKNSIITLSFYESNTINKEIIANDDPSAYNFSFFKRVGMTFENGWEMFTDLVIGLVNLWVFILLAISSWIIVARYKNKKIAHV